MDWCSYVLWFRVLTVGCLLKRLETISEWLEKTNHIRYNFATTTTTTTASTATITTTTSTTTSLHTNAKRHTDAMNLYFAMLLLVVTESVVGVRGSRCRTKHFGCHYLRAHDKCVCKVKKACINPFRYKTENECKQAHVKKNNPCRRNSCQHGRCMPKKWNKYSCDCLETGYYGKFCHKKCPQITLYYAMEHLSQFFQHKNWKKTLLACVFPRT